MDPLTVFPPEIVHQIWRYLEPGDLLAARAVAPHWLASVSDCPGAWVTDFSHDWTEFLAVKKAVRSWSSKNVRKQTVKNVRDCIFTEFAYYLIYGNGTLEMFSPSGKSVRTFQHPATDLHRANKCLLIGVNKTSKTSEPPMIRHHTIITDFVFNLIEDLFDTEIIASSPRGYSYRENGECFCSIGPDVPGSLKIPCPDVPLQFLTSCAVWVEGFTVKTLELIDANSSLSVTLKTITSSPRWIPTIHITPGPQDYFSAIVEQRDFFTIFVYNKDIPLFECSYPSPYCGCILTSDYFLLSLHQVVEAFKLTDFTKYHQLENVPEHDTIKEIKCESLRLVENTLAVVHVNPRGMPWYWLMYRVSEVPRNSSQINMDNTAFELKKQQLAETSIIQAKLIGDLRVSEFEIFPGYVFAIQSSEASCSLNDRVVHLLHFDL